MNEEFQKQLHLLYRYITYCFTFICLIFYGIGTCHASEHDLGRFSNSTSVYLSVPAAQADIYLARDTYNQAGLFDAVYVHIDNSLTINSNYVYQMEISTPGSKLTSVNSAIAVQFVNNGINQSCNVLGVSDLNIGYPKVYFQCKNSFTNGSMIFTLYDINGSTTGLTNEPQYFKWGYTNMRYYDDATDIDWGPVTSNANANTDRIISNDNANTNSIINNFNQKTTQDTRDIVNGAHQDTNSIINNQRNNTQSILDDNKKNFQTCRGSKNLFDKDTVQYKNGYALNENGVEVSSTASGYTLTYYPVTPNEQYTLQGTLTIPTGAFRLYFYDENKQWLSRSDSYSESRLPLTFTPPANTYFIRIQYNKNGVDFNTIMLEKGSSASPYEPYGEEICVNKLDEQNNQLNNLNDNLNNDDTTVATSEASDFFSSFSTDTFGLTSIITAPLNLINSVLSSTCTSLQLPLPYLNNRNLELPCMSSIYSQYFGTFFTIYQTITYGIIAYWVCVRIFNQVKDFKNPEHDEIEVMDL